MSRTLQDYALRVDAFCSSFGTLRVESGDNLSRPPTLKAVTRVPLRDSSPLICTMLEMQHEDLEAQAFRNAEKLTELTQRVAVQLEYISRLQQTRDRIACIVLSQLIVAFLPRNENFASASALTREALEKRESETIRAANWFLAGLASIVVFSHRVLCPSKAKQTPLRVEGGRVWWTAEAGSRLPLFFSSDTKIETVYTSMTQLHAAAVSLLRRLRLLPFGMSFDFEEFGSLAVLANLLHKGYSQQVMPKC